MSTLYPLKLKPIFKEKIWGGNRVKEILNLDYGNLKNCGEVWVFSGIEDNESIVENGFLKGNSIVELAGIYMDELLGEQVFQKYGTEIPLLLKFLDTNDYLSIQVHPDDELANKIGKSFGKHEFWYIIHAEKDAEIINGFDRNVTEEEFLEHISKHNFKEILHHIHAKKNMGIEIPPKRIHALGPGILLAEIQQSSDTTYRVYDWNRKDKSGNTRELHLNMALQSLDFKRNNDIAEEYTADGMTQITENNYFKVNRFRDCKDLRRENPKKESFTAYMCLQGSVSIDSESENIHLQSGECCLIPAILDDIYIRFTKNAELLEIMAK